ncbi:hypothetical protein MOQ72_39325 [Saccharopolyspora sp. K220]|uniref:hypothetical protein n=1 Tax=Saccharopolyspora soli TaxID=2926618 RepID=UPI001F580888|nr:hypothetical protein [Saccharopolyspora soli]MCI2423480.1 hypothetical protein [Saccharopolyspora soli]
MRSLSRIAVVSAFALPLAIGGAGMAAAAPWGWDGTHKDDGDKNTCIFISCNDLKWDWTHISDDDVNIINAGIID